MSQQNLQKISGQSMQMFAININANAGGAGFHNKKVISAQSSSQQLKQVDHLSKSNRGRNYSNLQSTIVGQELSRSPQEKADLRESMQVNAYGTRPSHFSKTKSSFLNKNGGSSVRKLPSMTQSHQSGNDSKAKLTEALPSRNKATLTLHTIGQTKISQASLPKNLDNVASSGPYQQNTIASSQYGTLGGAGASHRSQTVAEHLRQRQKWRFQQNQRQADPLNQKVMPNFGNPATFSKLELRGKHQGPEKSTMASIIQQPIKKQRQVVGIFVNPGLRPEAVIKRNHEGSSIIINGNSKASAKGTSLLKTNHNNSLIDSKLSAKRKMINTILDSHNSQHILTAYTSVQNNLGTNYNSSGATSQTLNLTPRKVQRMASGAGAEMMPIKLTEQFRSKTNLSMSQRNHLQNNSSTQMDRPSYRKGEMIDDVIFNSQKGFRTHGRGSTFQFDRHLSKQGSSNLQRYYKLKETIIANTQRTQNATPQINNQSQQHQSSELSQILKDKGAMISIVDQTTSKMTMEHSSRNRMHHTAYNSQFIPMRKQQAQQEQTMTSQQSTRDIDGRVQQIYNLKTKERGQMTAAGGTRREKYSLRKDDQPKKNRRSVVKRFDPLESVSNQQIAKQAIFAKRDYSVSPKIRADSPTQGRTKTTDLSDNYSSEQNFRKMKSIQKLMQKQDKMGAESTRRVSRNATKSTQKQVRLQSLDDKRKVPKQQEESIDGNVKIKNYEESITIDNYMLNVTASPQQKQFFRTEDGQLQQADSDDEYTVMQRQIQQMNSLGRDSLSHRSDALKQSNPKKSTLPNQEYGLIDENKLTSLKVSHDFHGNNEDLNTFKKAKKMLTSLKAGQPNPPKPVPKAVEKENRKGDSSSRLAAKSMEMFKLATQMSKQVKYSNNTINKVLNTLNSAQQKSQMEDEDNGLTSEELQNIGLVDTATLLNNTNVSIKNLNYSLMKLVAVQQESQIVAKATLHPFLMIDRLPAYFEVNATTLPHPAKIWIRADPQNNNGIQPEVLNEIVTKYVHVYVSTQSKNPSSKNNMLQLDPPLPKMFSFAPVGNPSQYMASDGQTVLGRDQFDKIFVSVYFDLSNLAAEDLYKPLEHLFKADEKIDQQKIMDKISHLNMQMMVKFPKDKEEIQKKRMAALMKKLKATQGQSAEELTGDNGEQNLQEINKQLTQYYQQQKSLIQEAEQQKQLKANLSSRKKSDSPTLRHWDSMSGPIAPEQRASGPKDSRRLLSNRHQTQSQMTNQSSKITQELENKLFSKTEQRFYEKKPQAYDFLSSEATGIVRYNQLLDMYAMQVNMQQESMPNLNAKSSSTPNFNKLSKDDLHDDNDLYDDEYQDSVPVPEQYGTARSSVRAPPSELIMGPIDHIARNVFISSKYRQINGIRSHLNHDMTATRIQNSQQKAEMHDLQRRLKSQQWLTKWDDFRAQKSIYVARVLAILKSRRKAKNLIAIIVLSKFVRGIIANYGLIKEFNMKKFMEFMIAIRLYVKFQRRFKGRYGQEFSKRMRNIVRLNTTFMGKAIQRQTYNQAGKIVLNILRRKLEKQRISDKFEQYHHKVRYAQLSVKAVNQMCLIKDHTAVLRILQEFMVLRHFYMSQPSKNKLAQRILARLQQGFEQIAQEIRSKKSVESYESSKDLSEDEGENLLSKLVWHIKLYDKVSKMKYQLNVMENVQHQYALLLKYLESSQEKQGCSMNDFQEIRNNMIETFKRQKELAAVVSIREEELYGVNSEFINQPAIVGKKDKKGEPKEYDLKQSYKYLNQVLLETNDEVFEALHMAGVSYKLQQMDDRFDELVLEDMEDEMKQQHAQDKKQQKKKAKEKGGDSGILETLSNEEHQLKLRNDRQNTIKLIQYYNNKPENKILHSTATLIQKEKNELYEKSFNAFGAARVRTRASHAFDKERIFILNEDDAYKFDFIDEFKEEVVAKAYDYIGTYQREYKRNEVFKIIFKVLKVHESMAAGDKDKKAEKAKDNAEDGKAAKKQID